MTRPSPQPEPLDSASVDQDEVAKFSALAKEWWDPAGKLKPLHALNPTRLAFIRDSVATRVGRDPLGGVPLDGLSVLDIGCGGGLLTEPLCRMGAEVTGIDASAENIAVASRHAEEQGLTIDYRHCTAESLAASGRTFDAVVTMEVVEHVADLTSFLEACGALVKAKGCLVAATLNRTPKSFLLAIVGAEYLLRWVPRGTHDWRRFVRPSELAGGLRQGGLEVAEVTGVAYNPLTDTWRLARDTDVNYMIFATKG